MLTAFGRHSRIAQIAERLQKRCGTSTAGAPQRCADFAVQNWLGSPS